MSTKTQNFEYRFHTAPNDEWEKVTDTIADEYISKQTLPPPNAGEWVVNRGAFDAEVNGRYTQLIPYSRLEDFQADNETFEVVCESPTNSNFHDPRGGFLLPKDNEDVCTKRGCSDCHQKRLYVYMGPGLWFDEEQKVHIRLSPTHNGVPGLADYAGETNPNQVPLWIVAQNKITLTVHASSNVQFWNLSIHHGEQTINIETSANIVFDNVIVRAGQYGVKTAQTTNLRFSNCVFDGGLPTWLFRSDIKDEYAFISANGQVDANKLAKQTMETLFTSNGTDTGTEINHCEFTNAHDLYLAGTNVTFHHNLIRNLNDDALLLDGRPTANGNIHHNVIEQSLTAFSFGASNIVGPWNIYRNLIDKRKLTAGIRPQGSGSNHKSVWLIGRAFKSNGVEGSYNVFQNTFVVSFQVDAADYPKALFDQMRAPIAKLHKHTVLNNIFVVVASEVGSPEPAIANLPQQNLTGDVVTTNGNLFYRQYIPDRLVDRTNLFSLPILGDPKGVKVFTCVPQHCAIEWRGSPSMAPHPFFAATQSSRPPGDEANGILLQDPAFSFGGLGEPNDADDFRLQSLSPARNAGVALPSDLTPLDVETLSLATRDIGAYQTSTTGLAPKLRVGPQGRRVYPESGPGF